jgi:deoxycytidylate deaminase
MFNLVARREEAAKQARPAHRRRGEHAWHRIGAETAFARARARGRSFKELEPVFDDVCGACAATSFNVSLFMTEAPRDASAVAPYATSPSQEPETAGLRELPAEPVTPIVLESAPSYEDSMNDSGSAASPREGGLQEVVAWPAADGPELFVGLVGAIGTDLDRAEQLLKGALRDVDYEFVEIHLSHLLAKLPGYADLKKSQPFESYYDQAIRAGNAVRKRFGSDDALAQIAVIEVVRKRNELNAKLDEAERDPRRVRRAYIFHQLKLPDEIALLREVYGQLFYCVAIYANEDVRRERLRRRIASYYGDPDHSDARTLAQDLIDRDQKEQLTGGQDVRGAFVQADYFVRSDDEAELERSLGRFVRLVFDEPYLSPTKSEIAMMHARSAALRSVDLARQVGAAIIARDGRILTSGCNEVPRAGGGQYSEGELDDTRDFQLGYDANDRKKHEAIVELVARLTTGGQLEGKITGGIDAYVRTLEQAGLFKDTRIDSLIEFGRIVHAEMAAIDASCVGTISIRDADLYCTTFPCHMCTRLIVNVGIRNVFYIEPYPKSATRELYSDSVKINPLLSAAEYASRLDEVVAWERRVYFLPFDGVAPRRYGDLFSFSKKRKEDNGDRKRFVATTAKPRQSPRVQKHFELEKEIAACMSAAVERWVKLFEEGTTSEQADVDRRGTEASSKAGAQNS